MGTRSTSVAEPIEMIAGDGLFLHLNPLQEALQSGGNTAFGVLARKIEEVCRRLEVPVIVKEVGFGITGEMWPEDWPIAVWRQSM